MRIEDIIVGERRREDMGDIGGLAESIKAHGLMQPVVVDANNNLIAGGRRLAACRLLGWTEIDVRNHGALSYQERRLLELEENGQRKDLTEYEKAKDMVEIRQVVAEIAREETRGESPQVSTPARGPARSPGSYRDVEARTGIAPRTIQRAETHVATADAHPYMKSWPQYRVLEAREVMDQFPEEERPEVSKLLDQPAIPPTDAIQIARNLAAKAPEERAEIYQQNASPDAYERKQALARAADKPPMPDQCVSFIKSALLNLRPGLRLVKDEHREEYEAAYRELERLGGKIRGSSIW